MKRIAEFLERHPLVRILDALSKFSILVALSVWVYEIPDRTKQRETARQQKIMQAWSLLSESEFLPTSPVRGLILQDLINEKQSMQYLDLRIANLKGLQAEGADFSNSYLMAINLNEAHLKKAKFRFSYIEDVDFGGTDMAGIDFHGAVIVDSDFNSVKNLDPAALENAILHRNTGIDRQHYLPNEEVLQAILQESEIPSTWLDADEVNTLIQEIKASLANEANSRNRGGK